MFTYRVRVTPKIGGFQRDIQINANSPVEARFLAEQQGYKVVANPVQIS